MSTEKTKTATTTTPKTFDSLSSLMTSHAKSNSPNIKSSSQPETAKKGFGTLADLTAHHLQKSNSSIPGKVLNPSDETSKSNFFIPKFTPKKFTGAFSKNSSSVSSEPIPFNLKDSPDSVDFLQTVLSSVHVSEEIDKENTINGTAEVLDDCQTLDEWTIDLSSALRQTKSITNVQSNITKFKSYKDNKTVQQSNEEFSIIPLLRPINPTVAKVVTTIEHECNLNSSYLIHAQLTHSNKVVSLFGKMLCKRWRCPKPYVERAKQQNYSGKVKRFDFMTPSPDSIILSKLQRR